MKGRTRSGHDPRCPSGSELRRRFLPRTVRTNTSTREAAKQQTEQPDRAGKPSHGAADQAVIRSGIVIDLRDHDGHGGGRRIR